MDLYREELLEHYRNPLNYGRLTKPTKTIHEANPQCGDSLELDLAVEDGVIKDIKFEGVGCAVSVAAASMLFEKVKGMGVAQAKEIKAEEVLEMVNPNLTASRVKCATLGYNALLNALGTPGMLNPHY